MAYAIQAIIILLIELNIYMFLGCAMKRIPIFPKHISFLEAVAYGFCAYHFLFWCMAFPSSLKGQSLDFLANCWVLAIGVSMVVIVAICRREVLRCYRQIASYVRNCRAYLIPFFLVVFVITYYVCVNGQVDLDARQYIGEVTMRVDTNSLSGIDAISGQPSDNISARYGMAMFGANSAVLCVLYGIHPLIFCRIERAAMNILMLAIVLLLLFYRLYRYHNKAKASHEVALHALMGAMLSLSFLFLFANTIYTSSAFILNRAYEGKAYCSSVMLLVALYLSIRVAMTQDKRYFALLFITMSASLSLSGSAALITPLVAISVVGAWIFLKHRWSYLPFLAASLLPNFYYFYMVSVKFEGLLLEG